MKRKIVVIFCALALIIFAALLLTGSNETKQAEPVQRPDPQPAEVVESPYMEPTPEPSVATKTEPTTAEASEVEEIEPEQEKPVAAKPNAPKAEEPKEETGGAFKAIITHYCAATFGSLGDVITIDGIDYEIVDRMGGNDGKHVDIFVADGHARCNELGRYTAEVTIK